MDHSLYSVIQISYKKLIGVPLFVGVLFITEILILLGRLVPVIFEAISLIIGFYQPWLEMGPDKYMFLFARIVAN